MYAAVDIGSNAARLLIKSVSRDSGGGLIFKKEFFFRYPLRLGEDVFVNGKITKERRRKTITFIKACKQIMELYNVVRYRCCATSAMRDASNGKSLIADIKKETGITVEIISGSEEAAIVYGNHIELAARQQATCAYVDVGGGSTEISLIRKGVKESAYSYNIGTLRMLHRSEDVNDAELEHISADMKAFGEECGQPVNIIGSGGNINKLYKLAQLAGLQDGRDGRLAVSALKEMLGRLKGMDVKERMSRFELKPDRADVIVPAGEIFLDVADALRSDYVLVPSLGLADGIVERLYMEFNSWK